MDDLGAEHLSDLSRCKITKSVKNVAGNISKEDDQRITGTATDLCIKESDSLASSSSFRDSAVVSPSDISPVFVDEEDSSSDGKEKTDATPENVKKLDDVIAAAGSSTRSRLPNKAIRNNSNANEKFSENRVIVTKTGVTAAEGTTMPKTATATKLVSEEDTKNDDDDSASKQCMAFTVDFGDNSTKDTGSAAAKYKSMVERFQNRHKRGASMSKLEGDGGGDTVGSSPRALSAQSSVSSSISSTAVATRPPVVESSESNKVKLRIRERSSSRVRDASLRHSWSPRSSTHEPQTTKSEIPNKVDRLPRPTPMPRTKTKPVRKEPSPVPPTAQAKFTPRSTAMQMALGKIDFYCPQPPLEGFVHQMNLNGGPDDNVSETGTYTLDGDNYTEEQKELMNIDKTASSSSEISENRKARPVDLAIHTSSTTANKLTTTNVTSTTNKQLRNNVLEINYYHDSTNFKPKTSYLDKIKSRVKNITKHPDKQKQASPDDLGTFTSITTSGVLAKKSSLDTHPKLARKSSLSKSQIDSSEYVSSEAKLRAKANGNYNGGGYTDHQKAEYRLNVFTNQTDSQILCSIESPESPTNSELNKLSDTAVLKTAQTKNDWIQEWARNARARSVASAVKVSPVHQSASMTGSLHCDYNTHDDVSLSTSTEDSMLYRNKHIDRFRLGEFDYSSDPNVSQLRKPSESVINTRPPKSPTKIPSPLHSIGRTRNTIRTRGSLQNIVQANDEERETDVYLQKTATAISNLAQSLSRKNSLKSTSSMNSPRRLQQLYYSADEYSPQHQTIPHPVAASKATHRRNFSVEYCSPNSSNNNNALMTNSLNEHLMDFKLPRARKNSFDAQALTVSPARTRQQQHQNYYIDQTRELIKQSQPPQTSLSPLRRSSSFSVKPLSATTTRTRPPQTLYTPPAVRHQYVQRSNLQKSASSNSFRKIYSDYDDAVEYYINDEDDLVDEYCSSEEDEFGASDNCDERQQAEFSASSEVPLSNTRYNKALLMRIERSKQKVAGNAVKPAPGGVMACPNTPELPRRSVQSAPRASMRQSVPRDTSLNRMKGQIPNSLASAKKQILQTATSVEAPVATSTTTKKVQPKYLDISKYKPAQGANFLRKNDAKSTLKPEIRRSPSTASVGITRTDPTRTSNRSTKSAVVGGMPSRNASVARRDSSVSKQKETELAMWKRRATYDPMKAAAEDRKKKEEAKKSSQVKSPCESSSVARSQSFHYGVGVAVIENQNQPQLNNRWTYASNDSSDEDGHSAFNRTIRS